MVPTAGGGVPGAAGGFCASATAPPNTIRAAAANGGTLRGISTPSRREREDRTCGRNRCVAIPRPNARARPVSVTVAASQKWTRVALARSFAGQLPVRLLPYHQRGRRGGPG